MTETMVTLQLDPVTPAIGAVASGVDLRSPLDAGTVDAIRQGVLEHGVVFFRDQDLDLDQMAEFISRFGETCTDPFTGFVDALPPKDAIHDMPTRAYAKATAVWHSDSSLAAAPASLIALRAMQVPPAGGDTCWANMYDAYDALSAPMQEMLDGLTAWHAGHKTLALMGGDSSGFLQEDMRNVHPVIRVHPETGRKALFVNELWTERIVELEEAESAALLGFLYDHVKHLNFMVRWHWKQHDLALWDNRSTQHFAVRDYDFDRVMQKVLLKGDRPVGPR